VAITRAKRSLWVLGHAASLRAHHVWRELLGDAEARGCLVSLAQTNNIMTYDKWHRSGRGELLGDAEARGCLVSVARTNHDIR